MAQSSMLVAVVPVLSMLATSTNKTNARKHVFKSQSHTMARGTDVCVTSFPVPNRNRSQTPAPKRSGVDPPGRQLRECRG
jgi:hypothetical protein